MQANPPQLYSNLLYIQRYRRESHLVSEPAYYFTNIFSAESFIWNINAKTLSIDELEFQKNMESARALLPGISTNTDSITATSQTTHHDVKTERIKSKESQASENRKKLDGKVSDTAKSESVSVLETKGANDLLKEEELRKYFSEYQFLYASAGDLTVKDVENLLDNYKQLVLKYVSLLKGIGAFNPSFPSSLTEKSAETSNTREPNDVKESDRDSDKFDVFCKAVEDSISESPSDQTDQIMESNDHHEFPDADGNSSVNTWTEDSGMLGFNLSPTRVEEILNSDTIGNSITNISKDHGSLDSDSEKTQRSNEAAVP